MIFTACVYWVPAFAGTTISRVRAACIRGNDEEAPSLVRAAFLDIGFDHQLGAAAKACAIDLQVFHNPRDVVARFGDREYWIPRIRGE